MIDYTKYRWLDPMFSLDESCLSKEKEAKRLLDTLDKKDYMPGKKNILACYFFDQCKKYAEEGRLDQIKLDSNLTKEFNTWPKSQSFKKLKEHILGDEQGKFIMSGIVIVMTGTLILFFLVAMLTDKFLINKWVDTLVGALAIVFFYRNMKSKYKLLKKYTKSRDFLYMDIASIAMSVLVKMMLPQGFDFTLIILFISHFISKKKFEKVLEAFVV